MCVRIKWKWRKHEYDRRMNAFMQVLLKRKGQLVAIFIYKLKCGYFCWVTLKDSCLSLLRTAIRKCTLLRARHLLRPIYISSLRFSPIGLNLMRLRSRITQFNPTKSTTSRGDRVWHCKPSDRTLNLPRRWSSRGSRFDKCIHLNHSLNLRSTHIHRKRKVWFQGSSRPNFPSRSINHRSIGLGIHPRLLHL